MSGRHSFFLASRNQVPNVLQAEFVLPSPPLVLSCYFGVDFGQEETVSVTHNYRDLIEVLAACSVNNNSGPVDISEHIKAKFYLSNRHRSIRSQDIVAMLCDLQDMGLISLTRYSSNCQLSFQKHGIRLNETADQLKRLK